ncbi:MAG: dihydrodipicolinate synthase family protein [Gammaproteobacteria bacterium]|nr:dihydrodipicolinate synthase family protein [Gammaproteobacteria bacterium]
MTQTRDRLKGVCTPVCTVFAENGRGIDETAQKRHIDTLVESGVHILCICGGTGEFSFLTREERLALAELAAGQVRGRARLIVHVSAVMTEETIEYARHAEGVGADCLLVLPPYFEGPTLEGTFEHYEKVARAVNTEIMAYNIPVHSGIDLEPDFVRRLMAIDNINYLKDSTGDFIRIQQLTRAGIHVFNGADPLMLHGLMVNAAGCFWGTSNAIPKEAVRLYEWAREGQWDKAMALWHRIYPVNDFVWNHPFNPGVKALCRLLGHDLGECRRPVQPLADEELLRLREAAEELL